MENSDINNQLVSEKDSIEYINLEEKTSITQEVEIDYSKPYRDIVKGIIK